MSERRPRTAALWLVPVFIVLVVGVCLWLGAWLGRQLELPPRLGLPLVVRLLGGEVVLAGLALMGWVLGHRAVGEVWQSTADTIARSFFRPVPSPAAASEPLVVVGPHRYLRHPLYAAVLLMLIGWWLVFDQTALLLGDGWLFLWFRFVVTYYEERELRVRYGAEWTAYAAGTPRFWPRRPRRAA